MTLQRNLPLIETTTQNSSTDLDTNQELLDAPDSADLKHKTKEGTGQLLSYQQDISIQALTVTLLCISQKDPSGNIDVKEKDKQKKGGSNINIYMKQRHQPKKTHIKET